jgi:hypothetical protein
MALAVSVGEGKGGNMTWRQDEKLLRALLGPKGPELSCEECFDELDRYVELELAGEDPDAAIPEMHAHLEGCPACHQDHVSLRSFATSDPAADAPSAG